MKLLSIISEVGNTSSRNEKEEILSRFKNDEELKSVIRATYDPRLNYYIRDYEEPSSYQPYSLISMSELTSSLSSVLNDRRITGNNAKKWFTSQLALLDESDAKLAGMILRRDLRCGASASTFNKVFPELIYQHPYMRCSGLSEKTISNIAFPCYSQTKADGLYCDLVIDKQNNKVHYMSRSGNYLNINDENTDKELLSTTKSSCVIQGEILVYNESLDGYLPREESNGYINSDNIDPSRVIMKAWDCVPYEHFLKGESKTPYIARKAFLEELINCLNLVNNDIVLIDSKLCETVDELIEDFREKREAGEEGTIVKNTDGFWKNGTSKDQIKVKVIMEIDLKIVGYKMGSGKYEGKIGSIQCETSDGLLTVSAGSGLSDKQRSDYVSLVDGWVSEGKIATLKVNGVMKSGNPDQKHSCFLPRLKEIRMDKNEADSYSKVLEQEESFTDMLKLI